MSVYALEKDTKEVYIMEVRNCKNCGTLFNHLGGAPICPACQKEVEDKFEIVKEYIYDNPGANIQRVSDDNDVTVAQIKKWVREERLEFTESSAVFFECESCGASIRTGRFCNKCKDKMTQNLGNLYKEKKIEVKKPKRESERMRFLDK